MARWCAYGENARFVPQLTPPAVFRVTYLELLLKARVQVKGRPVGDYR